MYIYTSFILNYNYNMKKSLLTSGFLFGLISFSIGQITQKKHLTPTTNLQHDNEIIALKKQDLQKVSHSASSSSAFIPITPEKLIKPKKEYPIKSKSLNK